jgi:hypothetical protein
MFFILFLLMILQIDKMSKEVSGTFMHADGSVIPW